MALKNYTSTVSVARSIAFIEAKLIQNGASHIVKYYDDQQRVKEINFSINHKGTELLFKLPARVTECGKILLANTTSRTKNETLKKIPAQAERTAWKILSDWVEAQMAMIELAQVEMLEVFLPYLFNKQTNQTCFEYAKNEGFQKLLPGK